MALCLAIYDAAEINYFYFSPTMFQFLDIHLSAEEAAYVSSVLSAAYTFGRLCTAFISIKLRPDVIIGYHFVIIVAAKLVLFFGRDSHTTIYVGTVVLGKLIYWYKKLFQFSIFQVMASRQCGPQFWRLLSDISNSQIELARCCFFSPASHLSSHRPSLATSSNRHH